MSRLQERRLRAERLFITRPDLSLEEISRQLDVPCTTLSDWMENGLWGKKRRHYFSTGIGAEKQIRKLIFKSLSELDEKEDLSAIEKVAKLVLYLEKLSKSYDILGACVMVMERYIDYLEHFFPEQLSAQEPMLRGFFDYLKEE